MSWGLGSKGLSLGAWVLWVPGPAMDSGILGPGRFLLALRL